MVFSWYLPRRWALAIVGEYVQSGESSMPSVKAHVSIPSLRANGDVLFLVGTGASSTVLLPEGMRELQIEISLWKWLWWFANRKLSRAQGTSRALYRTVHANLTFQDSEGGTFSHTVELEISGHKVGKSLLGGDVLSRYRCTLNASKNLVILESSSGGGGSPSTEDHYRELFQKVGIEVRRIGHTLRWRGRSMRCYFNRNRDVGVYFTANPKDSSLYLDHLWEGIDARRVKQQDRPLLNVRPVLGREHAAFLALVMTWDSPDAPVT